MGARAMGYLAGIHAASTAKQELGAAAAAAGGSDHPRRGPTSTPYPARTRTPHLSLTHAAGRRNLAELT